MEALIALATETQPDLIIGFGDGSAIDLAKLAALFPGSRQSIHDVVGPEKVAGRRCALAQVPTTSGTGSEAGTRSLVTDPATQNKLAVQNRHMLADLAVLDPDLTMTVPPAVTAATGVDAMAQCVEDDTSKKAHPLIDLYALEGIRLVGRYLRRAVEDGSDTEARAGLALPLLYGGFLSGTGQHHGRACRRVPGRGARHHIPHGLACALIFPHTLAWNAPALPERQPPCSRHWVSRTRPIPRPSPKQRPLRNTSPGMAPSAAPRSWRERSASSAQSSRRSSSCKRSRPAPTPIRRAAPASTPPRSAFRSVSHWR